MPSDNHGNIQMFYRKPAGVNLLSMAQKSRGASGRPPSNILSRRELKPNLGSAEKGLESAIEIRSAQGQPPHDL